jgi:hypothetical protein
VRAQAIEFPGQRLDIDIRDDDPGKLPVAGFQSSTHGEIRRAAGRGPLDRAQPRARIAIAAVNDKIVPIRQSRRRAGAGREKRRPRRVRDDHVVEMGRAAPTHVEDDADVADLVGVEILGGAHPRGDHPKLGLDAAERFLDENLEYARLAGKAVDRLGPGFVVNLPDAKREQDRKQRDENETRSQNPQLNLGQTTPPPPRALTHNFYTSFSAITFCASSHYFHSRLGRATDA